MVCENKNSVFIPCFFRRKTIFRQTGGRLIRGNKKPDAAARYPGPRQEPAVTMTESARQEVCIHTLTGYISLDVTANDITANLAGSGYIC